MGNGWGNSGNSVRLYLGGSKITADGDCSHEIKRCLLLGRKVMTNLDSILKSRDNTLPINVRLVRAMVFPVVRYGCESWTVREAERWRLDAFELWCWRRLLGVPWWVWVNSGSWWWTGRPGRVGVAESDTSERLNWIELIWDIRVSGGQKYNFYSLDWWSRCITLWPSLQKSSKYPISQISTEGPDLRVKTRNIAAL